MILDFLCGEGKNQKVCQSDFVLDDEFAVEKVYIVPGELLTLNYGPGTYYQILDDAADLQQYDFILGEKIPVGLKDKDTVIYRKHKYLFNPDDVVKVEIPDLFTKGYYVPKSAVVSKGTDECHVYINDGGKARLTKVDIVGGNDKYYNILGDNIQTDTELILLSEELKACIEDGLQVNIVKYENPVVSAENSIEVSVIKLEEKSPENKTFYGKIEPADSSNIKFSTYMHYLGYINSTLRPGVVRMSAVKDLDGNNRDTYSGSLVAEVDDNVYDYYVKAREADIRKAEAILKNGEIEYDRNKKLSEVNAVSVEDFDAAEKKYESAKAGYNEAVAEYLIAFNDYKRCNVFSAYTGVINKIFMFPGSWTSRDYVVMNLEIMTPSKINVKMDKALAVLVAGNYPVKVYPVGLKESVGRYSGKDLVNEVGLSSLIDNYLLSQTGNDKDNKYPVIEGFSR